MSTTRRSFLCGAIVGAAALRRVQPAWAQEAGESASDDDIAICSTNESEIGSGLEIEDFSSHGSGLDFTSTMQEFRITDYGTAMLSQRWRQGDGLTPNTGMITLGCSFMSGGSADQRSAVQRAAQGWLQSGIEQMVRFDFTAPIERAQIRINIGMAGNNSAIGRAALRVRKNQPTMNLQNLKLGTIQHEFGHSLGLMHEHLHPGFIVQLREDVVIADMRMPPNGWSAATTRLNILSRFGTEARCVGDPEMNPDSIMMYNVPRKWTVERRGFRRADSIQQRDLNCVRGLYSIRS